MVGRPEGQMAGRTSRVPDGLEHPEHQMASNIRKLSTAEIFPNGKLLKLQRSRISQKSSCFVMLTLQESLQGLVLSSFISALTKG